MVLTCILCFSKFNTEYDIKQHLLKYHNIKNNYSKFISVEQEKEEVKEVKTNEYEEVKLPKPNFVNISKYFKAGEEKEFKVISLPRVVRLKYGRRTVMDLLDLSNNNNIVAIIPMRLQRILDYLITNNKLKENDTIKIKYLGFADGGHNFSVFIKLKK